MILEIMHAHRHEKQVTHTEDVFCAQDTKISADKVAYRYDNCGNHRIKAQTHFKTESVDLELEKRKKDINVTYQKTFNVSQCTSMYINVPQCTSMYLNVSQCT